MWIVMATKLLSLTGAVQPFGTKLWRGILGETK